MDYKALFVQYNKQKERFEWLITINGEQFNYSTGIGYLLNHKEMENKGLTTEQRVNVTQFVDENLIIKTKHVRTQYDVNMMKRHLFYLEVPKMDDVLYCLFSDYEAGNYTFDDFCDNFGYSNDSIKALDIYRKCQQGGSKLRKALGKSFNTEQERIDALNM